jgi:hypothetical protein
VGVLLHCERRVFTAEAFSDSMASSSTVTGVDGELGVLGHLFALIQVSDTHECSGNCCSQRRETMDASGNSRLLPSESGVPCTCSPPAIAKMSVGPNGIWGANPENSPIASPDRRADNAVTIGPQYLA